MNQSNMTFLQTIEANWLLVAAVLVAALLLAIWLIGRATRPKVRDRRPDVLDEGAAPAQRNQALIDTPPAAAMASAPIVAPGGAGMMAGVGEVVAHAARDNAQAVEEVEEERASIEADMAQPEPAVAPDSEPVMPAPTAPLATETPAGPGEGDDLRKIKGVGPKLVTTLHALGVTRYEQIAGWTDADLDALDAQLGAFAGRPRRDSWVEQARLLSSGDTSDYESKFGKL